MFGLVSGSKYGKLSSKYEELSRKLSEADRLARLRFKICIEYSEQISALKYELAGKQSNTQFTPQELDRLIRLCHPDKHNNKQSSVEMTQKLLALRGK